MDKQLIALIVLFIGLLIKEVVSTNGRAKLHNRIDKLDKKYLTKEMCDERSGNIQRQLNKLEKGQDTILGEVRKRNGK